MVERNFIPGVGPRGLHKQQRKGDNGEEKR